MWKQRVLLARSHVSVGSRGGIQTQEIWSHVSCLFFTSWGWSVAKAVDSETLLPLKQHGGQDLRTPTVEHAPISDGRPSTCSRGSFGTACGSEVFPLEQNPRVSAPALIRPVFKCTRTDQTCVVQGSAVYLETLALFLFCCRHSGARQLRAFYLASMSLPAPQLLPHRRAIPSPAGDAHSDLRQPQSPHSCLQGPPSAGSWLGLQLLKF